VGLVGGVSSELSLMSSKSSHSSSVSTAGSVESHSSGMSEAGFMGSDSLGMSEAGFVSSNLFGVRSLSCLELTVSNYFGMSSFVEGDQLLLSLPGSSSSGFSSSSS